MCLKIFSLVQVPFPFIILQFPAITSFYIVYCLLLLFVSFLFFFYCSIRRSGFNIAKILKRKGWRHQGDERWGRGAGGIAPLLFCVARKKKWKQRKKRKSFKAETIKRLSPRSKCYCFSYSRASRIQQLFLSANHDDDTFQCSMASPLWNLFRRPWRSVNRRGFFKVTKKWCSGSYD